MIVYGTRLCGRVNEAADGSFVAMRFVHIWYIPLIPIGSWEVYEQHDDGFSGRSIPFSFKALFAAWFRTLLVFTILGCLAGVVMLAIQLLADGFSVWNAELQVREINWPVIAGLPVALIVGIGSLLAYRGSYSWFSSAAEESGWDPGYAEEHPLEGQILAVAGDVDAPDSTPWLIVPAATDFATINAAVEATGLVLMAPPAQAEPSSAWWTDELTRVDYAFDQATWLRTLHFAGEHAAEAKELVCEQVVWVRGTEVAEMLRSTDVRVIRLAIAAAAKLGFVTLLSALEPLRSHADAHVRQAAEVTWREIMYAGELKKRGIAA